MDKQLRHGVINNLLSVYKHLVLNLSEHVSHVRLNENSEKKNYIFIHITQLNLIDILAKSNSAMCLISSETL